MNKRRILKHLLTGTAFGVAWTIAGYFNDHLDYSGVVGGAVLFILHILGDYIAKKNQDRP